MTVYDLSPGRQQIKKTIVAVPNAANIALCGPDPRRVALLFLPTTANTAYVSPDVMTAISQGMTLVTNVGALRFEAWKDGDLCRIGWNAFGGAALNIVVIEVIDLDEQDS